MILFIPYTYGDEAVIEDELGPLGYVKCSKCKKMSLYTMGEGTLQKRIDSIIPAGRKRKSYIIQCHKCKAFFLPKVGREEELVEMTKQYPKDIDFRRIESKVSEFYSSDAHNYASPDEAIEYFPKKCVDAIAQNESAEYQKFVFDSATAFIYNKEWRKSSMGKIERKAKILAALIIIGIIALVIGAIAGLAVLIRNSG